MTRPAVDKAALRREFRDWRSALDDSIRREAARCAAGHLQAWPNWSRVQSLAVYLARGGELDPKPIATAARKAGKALYLPVLAPGNRLEFARWHAGDGLVENRLGIAEPTAEAERIDPARIDLLCLPLVAWNLHGDRLGMGGGYYDRTLAGAGTRCLKMGLGYEGQRCDALIPERWDIPLDFMLTESALYPCSSR